METRHMPNLPVSHVTTVSLKHNGDCNIIGVTADATIFAEEMYGDNARVAQYEVRLDGSFIQSVDEAEGANGDLQPLKLPPEISKPKSGWHTMMLNFAGPRHRGLRGPERTLDLVRPLAILEKMALIEKLKLGMMPPQLLGVAESYVLAESEIVRPNLYFVCRRVRLAFALSEEKLDADHQPYDYDTHVIYLAHFYDCEQEFDFSELLTDLTAVPLHRPMDCLLVGNLLY